jgi:hypothetical protein
VSTFLPLMPNSPTLPLPSSPHLHLSIARSVTDRIKCFSLKN